MAKATKKVRQQPAARKSPKPAYRFPLPQIETRIIDLEAVARILPIVENRGDRGAVVYLLEILGRHVKELRKGFRRDHEALM